MAREKSSKAEERRIADLKEKVRRILFEETPTAQTWAWEQLVAIPRTREVDEMEYISRLWGYAYGLAYGIARVEDADGPNEAVAVRAFKAAVPLFEDQQLHDLDFIRAFEAGKLWKGALV